MSTAFQTTLLVALIVVGAVHSRSRVAGAFSASAWCAGAIAFGALAFFSGAPDGGDGVGALRFLGVKTPAWLYFAFMGGLLIFNVMVIVRALRRRRPTTSPAKQAAAPAQDTGRAPGGS